MTNEQKKKRITKIYIALILVGLVFLGLISVLDTQVYAYGGDTNDTVLGEFYINDVDFYITDNFTLTEYNSVFGTSGTWGPGDWLAFRSDYYPRFTSGEVYLYDVTHQVDYRYITDVESELWYEYIVPTDTWAYNSLYFQSSVSSGNIFHFPNGFDYATMGTTYFEIRLNIGVVSPVDTDYKEGFRDALFSIYENGFEGFPDYAYWDDFAEMVINITDEQNYNYHLGWADAVEQTDYSFWALAFTWVLLPFEIFAIELVPGLYIGYFALIPIVFGLIALLFSFKGGKK